MIYEYTFFNAIQPLNARLPNPAIPSEGAYTYCKDVQFPKYIAFTLYMLNEERDGVETY
jgi:hypothetical protein